MRISSFFIAAVVFFSNTACARESSRAESGNKAPPTAQPQAIQEMGLPEAQAELPGFRGLEGLSPRLRAELVAAAKDEFVYDGSPYSLAGCLKEDKPCKAHALRGLDLLASALVGGASRSEALAAYTRYYGSFEQKNRKAIDLAGAPCLGNPDAPVTVVEFSDFECPYCAMARPMLEQAVRQAGDKARLCFMHFPLPGHSNAMSAAQATVYAQAHGKFWQLHDLLFENQKRLSPQTIRELVAQVGLDPNGLVEGVKSGELASVVEKQRDVGRSLGIQGTPTVFMNGRQYNLPLSPELLRFSIQDEIEWQANGGKWANE